MAGEIIGNNFPKNMNLLILGETGVGKSTFINGLVNYLKYESIEEALKEGVEILIRSQFTLTDSEHQPREIISEPTIVMESTAALNENNIRGSSTTQDPKSYVFSYGPNDDKTIRIIDTPGIGDTRGVDQDKKLLQDSRFHIGIRIHGVCVLVKPNTARLTIAFRFLIDELLVHLHRSASRNIVFCFTNTRGTLYRPGDTLPTLQEHLMKLKLQRNISIPLETSTLFSFDSESFRFLCACQNGFEFSDTEKRDFASSWSHSVKETLRLFERISQLPAHSVQETLSLNNTRNLILSLTRPLGEIAKSQVLNMQASDFEVQESIEREDAANKTIQIFVDKDKEKLVELKKEHDFIRGCCAEFAAFLSRYSIIPFNDSYGKYFDFLIKEETEKVQVGGADRMLDVLRVMKLKYHAQVELLQKSINSQAREVKTMKEINEMINKLGSLKHCATLIEEFKNIRLLTIKSNRHKIYVSGGMFG